MKPPLWTLLLALNLGSHKVMVHVCLLVDCNYDWWIQGQNNHFLGLIGVISWCLVSRWHFHALVRFLPWYLHYFGIRKICYNLYHHDKPLTLRSIESRLVKPHSTLVVLWYKKSTHFFCFKLWFRGWTWFQDSLG